VDTNLNLGSSGSAAKCLLSVGGKSLIEECKTKHQNGLPYGEVISIDGGNLKCKKLYLISLPDYEEEDQTGNDNVAHV